MYIKNKANAIYNKIQTDDHYRFSLITYFPVIGWIITLYGKKQSVFWQDHAKKAFIMSVVFVCGSFLLTTLNKITYKEWIAVRFFVVVVIYLFYIAYAVLCFIGAKISSENKELHHPWLDKLAGYIEL